MSLNADYLAKAKKLSKEQQERTLSRMDGNLPKRLKKGKISELEAIAIQLELEDEQLQEWRDKVASMRAKEEKSSKQKNKEPESEKTDKGEKSKT